MHRMGGRCSENRRVHKKCRKVGVAQLERKQDHVHRRGGRSSEDKSTQEMHSLDFHDLLIVPERGLLRDSPG